MTRPRRTFAGPSAGATCAVCGDSLRRESESTSSNFEPALRPRASRSEIRWSDSTRIRRSVATICTIIASWRGSWCAARRDRPSAACRSKHSIRPPSLHRDALVRTLFPECTSCGVDRSPNLRHSWRPLGLNKTRISIERLNGGGSYQVVVDVHDEAPVTTDELLSILTAIWGPETAQELKQLILDETGSFEAEAALPIWPIIMLLSILNSGEARVLSP